MSSAGPTSPNGGRTFLGGSNINNDGHFSQQPATSRDERSPNLTNGTRGKHVDSVPGRFGKKQTLRAFARWFKEASPPWPDDLKRLGHFAMMALDTLDVPKPHDKSVRAAAKDMAAFLEAYAAHIASKGA